MLKKIEGSLILHEGLDIEETYIYLYAIMQLYLYAIL